MKTARFLVVGLTFITTYISLGVMPSSIAGPSRVERIALKSEFYDPGSWVGVQRCHVNQTGLCKIRGEGTVTWTGTAEGTSDYFAHGYLDPTTRDLQIEVWETLHVTIDGCGEGQIRWHGTGVLATSRFDPVTASAPMEMEWDVMKGTGTGGLSGVTTGHVKLVGTAHFPTLEQDGTIEGYVMCIPS